MATGRRGNEVKLLGVVRRGRPALMMTTALQATVMLVLALPADAQPAPNAQPTGGTIVAGAAAISQTGSNTAINQSSQRAAVNWQSFNVGSRQSVTFNQPSASAVTLNRVTGPDPSQIAGRIDANGQIILVNQSGVTFYKGSQVNANGLVVSAAGVSTQNFMAGTMKFDQAAKPNARIDTQGTITIKQAGLAALVAPQVANSGVINARLGHVVLAGAKTATLDLYGDGLLSLDVTNQVTQTPLDKSGNAATALVTNTGVIVADGGTVQLTARAADGIVQNLVQAGGAIRAASVGDKTGVVALNGVGGSIVVEGQLSAPGLAPGTKGGAIEVATTGDVIVASTAKINASGKAGGGVVAIGTTLDRARGGPSVTPTVAAASTVIQPGAKISANATSKGDGGRVTVLSSKSTTMAGTVAAKGGPSGGNGGSVEVSGELGYSMTGAVDVSAPLGVTGSILLDPDNLEIINAVKNGGDQDLNLGRDGTVLFGDPNTAKNRVSNGEIDSLNGTIMLQANATIVVDPATPITLKNNASLILQTNTGDITVGAGSPITALGTGTLTMRAGTTPKSGGKININSDLTTDGLGTITWQSDGGVFLGNLGITTGTLILPAPGPVIIQSPVLTLNTPVKLGVETDLTIQTTKNDITINVPLTATGTATITLHAGMTPGSDGKVILNKSVTTDPFGAVTLQSDGGIVLAANLTTNTLDLGTVTSGGVTQTGGSISATTLRSTLGVAGAVSLTSKTNKIATSTGITATKGDLVLVDDTSLTLSGTYSGNNLFFEVANAQGKLTLGIQPPAPAPAVVQAAAAPTGPATLTATGTNGRISLVANNYNVGNTASTITTAAGTVQLAPFTAVNTSLLGETAGLVVGADLLNAIHTNAGTLEVGGFTNVPGGGTVPAASAATVTIDGAVNLTGIASTLRLDAVGAITEPGGPLTVTTLTGKSDSATLNNAKNLIANLAGFTTGSDVTPGGNFTLVDSGPLTITGPVSAGGTLTPNPLNTGHPFNSAILNLTAGGPLTIGIKGSAGTLRAGTVALSARGAITEPNGSIAADSFTASTTAVNGIGGGDVLLTSVNNKIAASAGISAANGNVVFLDDPTLVLSGLYSGANLFFEVTLPGGSLALGGQRPATLTTTGPDGRISLVADNVAVGNPASSVTATAGTVELAPFSAINTSLLGSSGLVIAPALLSIIHTAGGTLEVGGFTNIPAGATGPAASASSVTIVNATDLTGIASTLRVDSIGSITQTAGPLTVAHLTGSAGTSVSLTQPTNLVGTLGAFSTKAGFALVDNQALLVAGPVTDTGVASTLALTTRTGTITLAGTVDATNIVDLISAGAISQSGGSLFAGTLTGGAATSASLTQPTNLVGTLGAFSTKAGFALVDNQALLVTGPVTDTGPASTLALTTRTGDITLAGTVSATNIVDLIAVGTINQSGGTLIAGTLTGSALGAANLTDNNQIATLGNFSAGSFALSNGIDLLIAGTLNAANIAVLAPANRISLGDGAVIVTGGSNRPAGPIQPALEPVNGAPGALFQAANFTQSGSSTVLGQNGGAATLQIVTAAHAQFDPLPGLQATHTWLILDLANGTAAGNVLVNALDVIYTTPGGANLSGTIQGITGGPAAAAGFIQPAINVNYLFNGCIIAAAVCQPPVIPPTHPGVTPTQPVGTPIQPVGTPQVIMSLVTPTAIGLPDDVLTSALGGLYQTFLSGAPPALIGSSQLVLVALPTLPGSLRRMTDTDVVPPNISYLDY